MIELEVFGTTLIRGGPTVAEIRRLCTLATDSAGVSDGHLAVQFVDARRMAQLNAEHRHKPQATDVLSFPIDGADRPDGPRLLDGPPRTATDPVASSAEAGGCPPVPRELGDVVICPELAGDLREVVVHGVLHLMGMDHETDGGEMLELQQRLLREDGRSS